MLAHKVELHYGCCKMQVKFLQATTAGHRKGQWLIGCTKEFCCVQDTRDASVLTFFCICTYLLIATFAKDKSVTKCVVYFRKHTKLCNDVSPFGAQM